MTNPWVVVSVVAFVVNLSLGVYVLRKNPGGAANRSHALLMGCLVLWDLSEGALRYYSNGAIQTTTLWSISEDTWYHVQYKYDDTNDAYTITLTVEDKLGKTSGKSTAVQVIPERPGPPEIEDNHPPEAVILVDPQEGFEDITEFRFDARGSSDRDGDDPLRRQHTRRRRRQLPVPRAVHPSRYRACGLRGCGQVRLRAVNNA